MVQETDLVCLVYLVVLASGDPKSPQPLGDWFFCFQASILRPVSAGKFGASVVCACTTFHFQFVSTWEMDSADVVRVASLLKVLSSMCKFVPVYIWPGAFAISAPPCANSIKEGPERFYKGHNPT